MGNSDNLKIVDIESILPSNDWNFMFAAGSIVIETENISNRKSVPKIMLFICSYRETVGFFATHKNEGISKFLGNTLQLSAFKYFGKKESEIKEITQNIANAAVMKLRISLGSCLSYSIEVINSSERINLIYITEVWVDGSKEKIEFHLRETKEYDFNEVFFQSEKLDFSNKMGNEKII